MHDWPDVECSKILRNQADAMGPDSIILVAEAVIPERVQCEDTYCYMMDLTMFNFGGKERSRVDWENLFEMSGLELVKIWQASTGSQGVIEGRKKRL